MSQATATVVRGRSRRQTDKRISETLVCAESEMSADEWEINVSGRGGGREAKVQGGRMISLEREHCDTKREEQES